jgi:hypothetical protein
MLTCSNNCIKHGRYVLLEEAYGLPLPLESFWEFDVIVAATRALVVLLAEGSRNSAKPPWSVGRFVPTLVAKRWRHLFDSGELQATNPTVYPSVRIACEHAAEAEAVRVTATPHNTAATPEAAPRSALRKDASGNQATSILDETASRFGFYSLLSMAEPTAAGANLRAGSDRILAALIAIDGSVLQLSLGNYVEHLVLSVLGIDAVYPFLAECF